MKIAIKKKSYWPLAIWSLLLVLPPIALSPLLAGTPCEPYLTKLTLLYMALAILALFLYMTLTGRAYWVNGGPSYEETVGEPYRAYVFLRRHLVRFAVGTLALALVMIPSFLLNAPWGFDLLAFCASLIGAAISTLRIRF